VLDAIFLKQTLLYQL